MSLGKNLAFIGAGNMAEALVKGLLSAHRVEPRQITCSDRSQERGALFTQKYGVQFTLSNLKAVEQAEIVVLSVKPQVIDAVLEELGPVLDEKKLVISIAAGVPIAAIERELSAGARVIRIMPNTPALVSAGATALAPGRHATDDDLSAARALFDAIGRTVTVDEHLIDAVTGLSGSGPAYVFIAIEALADGGVKMGLPRAIALELAAQTVFGSAKLMLESGEHPGRLKDQVTSPGGTTIAGVHKLEEGRFRSTLIDAVEAATQRSHELGKRFASDK